MKKWIGLLLVLVMVLSLGLTGCGGDGDNGGGGGEEGGSTAGETIKIGLNYELTGGVASYGLASVEGIKMAVKEINAAGGVLGGSQIELVEIDNKSDAAEVVSVATRMMTVEDVVTIIGPATSGRFSAQEAMAAQYQIPILSGSATADNVTVEYDADGNVTSVKDWVFRICFSDSVQGNAMAVYAKENLGATSAAIVQDNSSDYAVGLAKNFRDTFEAGGGTIVSGVAYTAGDTDFSGILTSIRGGDFDVIFLPGYYEEVGLIVKQARELGITVPILGADGYDSPLLAELGGPDNLYDVYYSNHYSSLDEDPRVAAFIDDFKAEYGKDPDAFNALGYDCGYFIAEAIEKAGTADPIAIRDALENTSGFQGVTGNISVDENHNAVKDIVVIRLEDGEPASAERVRF